MTQFLLNPRKRKGAAHIMKGDDTLCRMLSTGGIPAAEYEIFDSNRDRRICHMCQNVKGHHTIQGRGVPNAVA